MNLLAPLHDSDQIAAIRDVLREETLAFRAKDFDRWAKCFLHDERTHDVYMMGSRGVIVNRGWENVARSMRKSMTEFSEKMTSGFDQSDFLITVEGPMAWATFYSRCIIRENEDTRYVQPDTFETRVLEETPDGWKIVYSCVAALPSARRRALVLQVDPNGKVLAASQNTLEQLKAFDGLTISNDRLRATRPEFDKPLQETFARAAELCHVWQSEFALGNRHNFCFPCLLGESETGGVLYCSVYVRSGAINVSFRDDDFVQEKIAAAAQVFGLSGAQQSVALEVSRGGGLGDVADTLGISLNTARTHLSRIYAKTGVNSQPALVRLLLSLNSLPS